MLLGRPFSEANAEFINVSAVGIFSLKTEGAWRDLIYHNGTHNPAVGLWLRNCSHVFVSSFGGNMRPPSTGTSYPSTLTQRPPSIYRFEDSCPVTVGNLVDQFQFAPDDDWNFVLERRKGVDRLTPHCERPVLDRRSDCQ